jgi:hypothetical protein
LLRDGRVALVRTRALTEHMQRTAPAPVPTASANANAQAANNDAAALDILDGALRALDDFEYAVAPKLPRPDPELLASMDIELNMLDDPRHMLRLLNVEFTQFARQMMLVRTVVAPSPAMTRHRRFLVSMIMLARSATAAANAAAAAAAAAATSVDSGA